MAQYLFLPEDEAPRVASQITDEDIQAASDGTLDIFRFVGEGDTAHFQMAECEVEEIESDDEDEETELDYSLLWADVPAAK